MIKVDRSAVAIPQSISVVGGAGDRERSRAMIHYANGKDEKFSFLAFKEDDVAVALKLAFNGKCAYCESKILHVGPPDIEHFRPKGKVAEDKDHPGYWWLASDWGNLLLSCRDCNSARYHIVLEDNGGVLEHVVKLVGKHCSFPLQGAHRAMLHTDSLVQEDPLLIDPTVKDPSNHLTWSLSHSSALAAPRTVNNAPDIYGDASVRGYALNRIELVQARLEHANFLMNEILIIRNYISVIFEVRDKVDISNMIKLLRDMVGALLEKSKPSAHLSAFSGYVIEDGLREVTEELRELLSSTNVSI